MNAEPVIWTGLDYTIVTQTYRTPTTEAKLTWKNILEQHLAAIDQSRSGEGSRHEGTLAILWGDCFLELSLWGEYLPYMGNAVTSAWRFINLYGQCPDHLVRRLFPGVISVRRVLAIYGQCSHHLVRRLFPGVISVRRVLAIYGRCSSYLVRRLFHGLIIVRRVLPYMGNALIILWEEVPTMNCCKTDPIKII